MSQSQNAGVAEPKLFQRMKVPLVSGATMIYSQVTSAFFGVFLAAFLGADDYGKINLARSIFAIAIVLSPFGLDLALQRHLGRTSKEGGVVAAEVFWPRLTTFLLSGVIAIALLVGGAQLLEQHIFEHAGFGTVLAVTMAALPFATDLGVLGGAYRGLYRPIPTLIATYVLQPTARMVIILALLHAVGGLSATIYGTLASYIIAWLFLAGAFHRHVPLRTHLLRAAMPAARAIFAYAPVLGLGNFLFTIARSLDIIALGFFATTAEVGRYAIVLMVGQMVGMIGASLGQTIGTSLTAAAEAGDNARVGALLNENITLGSMLSAPFCVAIAVWGHDIDLLLGPSYRIPVSVFVVAALTQWLTTAMHYSSWGLVATGRHVMELWNNVFALALQVVVCLVLVPNFGMLGAALSSLISLAAINIARQVEVAGIIGKSLFEWRLVGPMAVAIVVALPLALYGQTFGFRAWWLTGILASTHVLLSFALILPFFGGSRIRLPAVLQKFR